MKEYSNTTLVKVKFNWNIPELWNILIQIQHLLKLNNQRKLWFQSYFVIQIQHLLKLNVVITLNKGELNGIQIQHLLKLNYVI